MAATIGALFFCENTSAGEQGDRSVGICNYLIALAFVGVCDRINTRGVRLNCLLFRILPHFLNHRFCGVSQRVLVLT